MEITHGCYRSYCSPAYISGTIFTALIFPQLVAVEVLPLAIFSGGLLMATGPITPRLPESYVPLPCNGLYPLTDRYRAIKPQLPCL